MGTREDRHLIVTTYGMDGACSAAMLLQIHPKAEIVIASARRIAGTLEEIDGLPQVPNVVHICGVGIEVAIETVIESIARLTRKKRVVFWYCGREYLNEYEAALGAACKPIFQKAKSNTEIVRIFHNIPDTDRVRLLLSLSEQFVSGFARPSKTDPFWQDLIQASAARYFKCGDRGSFIHAIRKLAGIVPTTDADTREVDNHRQYGPRGLLLGESKLIKSLRTATQKIGPIDEPVLILGPTGSGKELVAWDLHEASRRSGPFVPVNCAVLSASSDLAHDRLFGHVKGAYTGAHTDEEGAFEKADGGTLFLDEIAELPLSVQTQLLRVLEERTLMRLGSTAIRNVDVRVIAATNRNLPAMIRENLFRADLYYRIDVLQIHITPLKERLEDMKSIATNLLYEMKKKGFSYSLHKEDWQAAFEYDWPGNVRQFINLLKRAVYLKVPFQEIVKEEMQADRECGEIHGRAAVEDLALFRPLDRSAVSPVTDIQASYMKHVLTLFDGNWSQASKALGVAVNTLRKWVEET